MKIVAQCPAWRSIEIPILGRQFNRRKWESKGGRVDGENCKDMPEHVCQLPEKTLKVGNNQPGAVVLEDVELRVARLRTS